MAGFCKWVLYTCCQLIVFFVMASIIAQAYYGWNTRFVVGKDNTVYMYASNMGNIHQTTMWCEKWGGHLPWITGQNDTNQLVKDVLEPNGIYMTWVETEEKGSFNSSSSPHNNLYEKCEASVVIQWHDLADVNNTISGKVEMMPCSTHATQVCDITSLNPTNPWAIFMYLLLGSLLVSCFCACCQICFCEDRRRRYEYEHV